MINCLFLILSISFITAAAVEESQYERVKSSCIDVVSWSDMTCEFIKDKLGYTKSDDEQSAIMDFYHGVAELAQVGYELSREVTHIPVAEARLTDGTVKRNLIIGLLSGYLKKNRLSTCQKVCLIKCASSHILNYKKNISTKFGSLKRIYDCEEGVCTDFSRVFDDLAKEFNITSQKVYSLNMRHSFNKVKLDGKWVYLETQNSNCEFYTK